MTVIAGENTFVTQGKTTLYKTGDSFVELPGMFGQARNAGTAPMAVMATFLLPQGEPLSHPVAPAPPSTGSGGNLPGLPSTGAGGAQGGTSPSVALVLAALGAGALIAGGWLVRRREATHRR